MRALFTALIAAVEACAIALAGLVLVAIPTLLMWWLVFHLAAEPEAIAQIISGIWFLGHLSPLEFVLTPEAAFSFGLPPEALQIPISIAPLGLTLLTVLLALRAGWRFAGRGGSGIAGVIGGVIGYGAAAWTIELLGTPAIAGAAWLAVLVAASCFAVGGLIGFTWCAARNDHAWWHTSVFWVQNRVGSLGAVLPDFSRDVVRYVIGGLVALIGLGAIGFAGALMLGYVDIVTLSQSMQLDPLGVVLLFLVNLLMLPTACIWSLAWFSGVGFSVGAGTSVTPFETLLGPIPALPILGAIPPSWGWAAALAPLLIVLIGVLLGVAFSGATFKRNVGWVSIILIPVVAAACVGLIVSGLAALAGGSFGPGRLRVNGPDPWTTGLVVALELGAGLLLGVIMRRLDGGRLRERFTPNIDTAIPLGRDEGHASSALPSSSMHTAETDSDHDFMNAQAQTVPLEPIRAAQKLDTAQHSPHQLPTRTEVPSAPAPLSSAETVPLPDLRSIPESTELTADAHPEDIVKAYAWGDDIPEVSRTGQLNEAPAPRNWWLRRRKR